MHVRAWAAMDQDQFIMPDGELTVQVFNIRPTSRGRKVKAYYPKKSEARNQRVAVLKDLH
jgi:hypothetical protein